MDLTFKTDIKTKNWRYLRFLPKELRFLGAFSIGTGLLIILLSLVFFIPLQQQIPLFYSLPGDQQLTDKKFIFILPILSFAINSFHLFIIAAKKEVHEHVLKMFMQLTFLLQILLLAILLRIIIIVS